MTFCRLELKRVNGEQLIESDFEAELLDASVKQMVSVMVRTKLLAAGEVYRTTIIPRNDSDGPGKPVILEDQEPPKGKRSITIESADGSRVDQVRYFSLQIHTLEKRRIYQFDLKVLDFMDHVLTAAAGVLLQDGTLAQREPFEITVTMIESGRPRVDVDVIRKLLPVRKAAAKTGNGAGESVSEPSGPGIQVSLPEKHEEELNIVIESVEQLVKPTPKSMSSYGDVTAVGKVADDELPILFRRGAYEAAKAAANERDDEEVGGFLVGSVFRDPDNDRLFVDISQVVAADKARGTYVSLQFNHEAWRQVLDKIERDFPELHSIGWYHTHLVSETLVHELTDKPNTYVAESVPFFSAPDHFIHRSFFRDPWHVALVLDVNCKKDVFFAWNGGRIRCSSGYYLYGAADG